MLSRSHLRAALVSLLALSLHLPGQTDRGTAKSKDSAGPLSTFSVKDSKFIVTGRNLTRVEIRMSPTGTGVTPGIIGIAHRASRNKGMETWILVVPPDLMAVKIFCVGYDAAHHQTGRLYLPATGASEVDQALYGSAGPR
jgi:hypothetical protein